VGYNADGMTLILDCHGPDLNKISMSDEDEARIGYLHEVMFCVAAGMLMNS
jgi:hypothetical protein